MAVKKAGKQATKVEQIPSTEAKSKDAVDQAINLITPTFNFVRDNFKDLFIKLLKVGLASTVVGILLMAGTVLLTAGVILLLGAPLSGFVPFMAYMSSNLVAIAVLVLWFIFVFFIISWISKVITLTKLRIIKEQFDGTYSGIWPIFHKIKFPVLGALMLNLGILAVGLGIPTLTLFLLKDIPILFLMALIVFIIYAVLFVIVYFFLAQFWFWELVVGEKGVYDSLKSSVQLVKNNLVGVFVFDIIMFAAAFVLSIPFFVIAFIIEIAFRLGFIFSMLLPGGIFALLGAIVLYVFFRTALGLVQSALTEAGLLPYAYSFWKSIK